jgi:hypothetical protein
MFWDRLTGAQVAPPGWAVAASAAVALLIVASPRFWRWTRMAITIAHEGGHGLASLLSGRRLEGIRLHSDTSGETFTRGRGSGLGIVMTALAGYLTPPLLGAGAAELLAARRVTLLLALVLVLLAVTLLAIRNWYGVLSVLVTAGAVLAVTWLTGPLPRAAFAYGVAWFLLFGGARPVVDVRRRPPGRAHRGAGRALGRPVRAGGGRRAGSRRAAARPPAQIKQINHPERTQQTLHATCAPVTLGDLTGCALFPVDYRAQSVVDFM